MSDITKEVMPNPDGTEKKHTSPWVMLTTFMLLITGLLLTSFMLLYYAWEHTDRMGLESFNFSKILNTVNQQPAANPSADPELMPQVAAPAQKEKNGKSIFPSTNSTKVKWPNIKLSGFGTSSDGSGGFAIINGEQVLQGGSAGKITLLEVHAHAIVVEYMGDQKTLTMGMEQ